MAESPTRVILDFDGTCTLVERAAEPYLAAYGERLAATVTPLPAEQWQASLDAMRARSPDVGWTLAGAPAAPAGADPYILAFETASLIMRERGIAGAPPFALHSESYAAAPAEWRPDAADTIRQLVDRGVRVAFVSNSSSNYINGRLDQLFPGGDPVRAQVLVHSDAGKFRIAELPVEDLPHLDGDARDLFQRLPAAFQVPEVKRPIYLRRGSYFEALGKALDGGFTELGRTVVCGDIWELDLAMPRQLGARIHLIERAPPYDTYDYERRAVAAAGTYAKTGRDLASLLEWFA